MFQVSGTRGGASVIVAVLLGFPVASAAAQARIDLEPSVGVYSGFGSFHRPQGAGPFEFPDDLSQSTGLAVGGQLAVWPSPRFGVRAAVFTASSDVGSTSSFSPQQPVPARVTTGAVEALVRVRRLPGSAVIYLSGGLVLVKRSGDAYEGFEGLNSVGGALGIGSWVRLSDRLGLQGDVRTLIYSLGLTDSEGLEYPSSTQTDLLAHVGLVFSFGEVLLDDE